MRRASLAALALLGCGGREEPLPELGKISFALLDQDGRGFGSSELEGHVVVANFIFTTCPTICPPLTAKMRELQQVFRDEPRVRFVSFTVDPENDVPSVLKAYANRHHVDGTRWRFLTGPPERVRAAIDAFKVAHGDREARPDGRYDIAHAGHFVLVDAHGIHRGYYRTDDDGLANLRRDVRSLLSNR